MKYLILIFIALPAFGSTFPNNLKRDFFVIPITNESQILDEAPETDCRDNIRKVICLVDPVEKGQDSKSRKCLEGGQEYAIYFERLYDNYPPVLQKMFCSLKYLFIEKKFFGTAYAGMLERKDGKYQGAMMGIRKSVLDENLNLTTWASWKEQLSFGGIADAYKVLPGLPRIQTKSAGLANDFLYFVVTHEFGHIFDFANDINKTQNCPEPKSEDEEMPECRLAENTWGDIGWQTTRLPHPINEFPKRKSLCFYGCEGKPMSKGDIPEVYQALHQTDFISTYAATNPWDDFSDSLAYYLMREKLNTSYFVMTEDGADYDIIKKLDSILFARKSNYIKNFLNLDEIKYP